MSRRLLFLFLLLPLLAGAQTEIGFIERFALAPDRERVLEQLVPGTEPFYYFHALHYQLTGQNAKLQETLKQWAARLPNSSQRRIIENRQALLAWETAPQQTAALLRERLNLNLDHAPDAEPDAAPPVAAVLDQKLISYEAFQAEAFREAHDTLTSFHESALVALIRNKAPLSTPQRRALISKIERPDVPGLVDLIATDLRSKESGGFGEFPIHAQLLPEQLDDLARRIPSLFDSEAFITARLQKLRPGADVDLERDRAEQQAWLERLWAYAKGLSSSYNSLKAAILYQRLEFDRALGKYDRARFLEYLKLPRPQSGSASPAYLRKFGSGEANVDFNRTFPALEPAPAISRDDALVRDYLLHFLADDATFESFNPYLRDSYLKPIFAEAKLAAGAGRPEQWAPLLSPGALQALKDRIEIEWSPANPQLFAPADDVALAVTIKNSPKLIVRVYELNALTFFLSQKRQLNTDLNLDGLIANTEKTLAFDDPAATNPFRRAARTIALPELKGKRGAWVVEVIGGGKSSRALIRKGQYDFVQEPGPAGDLITVIDENRAVVKDAVAWLEGRRYEPDPKLGKISIPFTTQAGQKPIVLASPDGLFASLAQLNHSAEKYELEADFQLAREQLLAGKTATLALRAALRQGGALIPMSMLEEPRLRIELHLLDGITSVREITPSEGLKFDPARLFTIEVQVPERLVSINATLTGKVPKLAAGGEKETLTKGRTWNVNGIAGLDATYDPYLTRVGDRFRLELRGRNGEPVRRSAVNATFDHAAFSTKLSFVLRTDDTGAIDLGPLSGIAHLHVALANRREMDWTVPRDGAARPSEIHLRAGEPLVVAWPHPGPLTREQVSLLEFRKDSIVADKFAELSLKAGALVAEGLTPGDYRLTLREPSDDESEEISVQITAGAEAGGWLLSSARFLQRSDATPVHIAAVQEGADAIVVQLAAWNRFARVHVAAMRYLPESGEWSLDSGLGTYHQPAPESTMPAWRPNLFVSGRELGDEYRYILERRYTKVFPGNLLPRPGLLLSPWETRATDLSVTSLATGSLERAAAGDREMETRRAMVAADKSKALRDEDHPMAQAQRLLGTSLDFLGTTAPAIYNLVPNDQGLVRIDRKALGDRHFIQIYAEDLSGAAWQNITLKEQPLALRDRRLTQALTPDKAFSEQKQITAVALGQTWTGAAGSDFRLYDSLPRVFGLFLAAYPNAGLNEFSFLLKWPELSAEEKAAKYSEYACHELNLFLARKDPDFFKTVVQPFLRNKKDRTFLDDYLLANDLTPYLTPWSYGQLNAGERALLARQIAAQRASVARQLREQWDKLPPNPQRDEHAFDLAMYGQDTTVATVSSGGTIRSDAFQVADNVNLPRAVISSGEMVVVPSEPAPAAASPAPAGPPGLDPTLAEIKVQGHGVAKDLGFMGEFQNSGGLRKSGAGTLTLTGGNTFTGATTVNVGSLSYGAGAEAAGRLRAEVRPFFRKIGPTKEWAENNYYHIRTTADSADSIIPLNPFWREFAEWDGQGQFLSSHFHDLTGTRSELLFALALLDLPFTSPKHQAREENGRITITAAGPMLVVHKEIVPAAGAPTGTLLVGENFFRADDRYRQEGNERFDKFVSTEFLSGVVYGASVVLTNPASSPQWVEVLTQIPEGAVPVQGTQVTHSRRLHLEAYNTQTLEYFFYFPAPREQPFAHHPVQVTRDGKLLATATARTFQVVARATQFDEQSWEHISQHGTEAQVLAYLDAHNLELTPLERIAWRARQSAEFLKALVALLEQRHVYSDAIYAYGVLHRDRAITRELLRHHGDFLAECGPWLQSTLLEIDPIERRTYEQLEYAPLINQRIHRVGAENRIVNDVFRAQYQAFMRVLSFKPAPDDADRVALVQYLFLQDRVEEALAQLKLVKADALPTKLQLDYLRCYAAFYEENLAEARGIASQYATYGVERWRRLFQGVLAQLDEIEGRRAPAGKPVPGQDGAQRELDQAQLAATEPSFEFKVEKGQLALTWKALREVTVNYYLMDPEFLFSSSPFATDDPARFAIVRPALSQKQALPAGESHLELALPEQFQRANLLIEIVGAGQRKVQPHHANNLRLNVVENYGRLDLSDAATGQPLPRSYVKVYARLKDGQIRFYKDGYTDLRGIFDYASLNSTTNATVPPPMPMPTGNSTTTYQPLRPEEIGSVDKLSLLVLTDKHGAATREVGPPAE